MKKNKEENGITLVALIITIIILLILAVVAIGIVRGEGILFHAKDATTKYTEKATEENSTLQGYAEMLKEQATGVKKVAVGKIATKNSTINGEVPNATNPIIPEGFMAKNVGAQWDAKEGPQIDKELVITDAKDSKDQTGNEFVWIPVNNINNMIMCKVHGASQELTSDLKCPICGDTTILAGKLYGKQVSGSDNRIGYYPNLTGQTFEKLGLREPDVMTGEGSSEEDSASGTEFDAVEDNLKLAGCTDLNKDGILNAYDFKIKLTNEFNSMVASVKKYGGFYVGRYEVSRDSSGKAQSVYGQTSLNAAAKDAKDWYGLYRVLRSYATNSVQGSMLWGCQYDTIMHWIGDNAAIQWPQNDATNRNLGEITGTTPTDLIKNIYDLYGNRNEATLTRYKTNIKVYRGARYDGGNPPSSFVLFDAVFYSWSGGPEGAHLALSVK